MDVRTECTIARAAHDVAVFATDPDRAPEWYTNIRSVEWRTPRPVRLGTQVAFVARFLGRRLAYTYEVVECDPPRRFVMRTAEGPFPMETTYAWEATPDGGTRMTLRNCGMPAGFSKWMAPLMAIAVRRANQQDLKRLKALLEAGPEPS